MTILQDTKIVWHDQAWMESRGKRAAPDQPISIYEVDANSWMRVPEDHCRPLRLDEIAPKLVDHVRRTNFTHVQLISATGSPHEDLQLELRKLTDYFHRNEIGVILDGHLASVFAMEPAEPWNTSGQTNCRSHLDGLRQDGRLLLQHDDSCLEFKWDAEWPREMLDYFAVDPLFRRFHHGKLFARNRQTFSENVILALSHDDVTRGKGSLLSRMPGDEWQKFANLRLLFSWFWAQPGKKLLFMGGEFGQWNEWNSEASLDWHLVREGSLHLGLQRLVSDLNGLYCSESALHQSDSDARGFEWGDRSESELSVVDWLRKSTQTNEVILGVFNFTPIPRHNHRVGVPFGGFWTEIFNSDGWNYGGSGQGNLGGVEASPFSWNHQRHSLTITLPPLGAVFFKGTS